MCPPSNAGIGKKLMMAKLALSMVRNIRSGEIPLEAASVASTAIMPGPPTTLKGIFP